MLAGRYNGHCYYDDDEEADVDDQCEFFDEREGVAAEDADSSCTDENGPEEHCSVPPFEDVVGVVEDYEALNLGSG